MTKLRSEFLSNLGKLFQILKVVADRVLQLGGNDENIAKIGSDGDLAESIANILVGEIPLPKKIYSHGAVATVLGDKIVSIKIGDNLFWLGQKVFANGRIFLPKGVEGVIVELYLPFSRGRTNDIFDVRFSGKDSNVCSMKLKDLEVD